MRTWFRESERTEHRSEGEAAAEGGADSHVLDAVSRPFPFSTLEGATDQYSQAPD